MVVAQCLQTERCSEISSSPCFVSSSTQFHSCAMMGLQATSGKRKLEGGVGCMDFDMELGESPSKLGRVEASWWAMDDSYGSSCSPTALGQTATPSSPSSYYDMEVVSPSSCLQSSSNSGGTTTTTISSSASSSCQLSGSSGSPASSSASTSLPSNLGGPTSPSGVPSQQQSSQQQQQSTQQQQQQQTSVTNAQSQNGATHHQSTQQSSSTQQSPASQHSYYQRSGSNQQQQQQQSSYSTTTQSTQQQQQQLTRPQATHQWGHHTSPPHHYEPPTIRREENGKSYLELGSSYRSNERCCEGSRSSWCRRGRACYRQRRLAVLNISMCKLARYRQFPDPSLHRSVLICNTLRYLEREMERDRSPPPMEPVMPAPLTQLQSPEQGRLTPFPMPISSSVETDVDSGIGDSDDSRSINWGSVLSLSSQSPLDPLNNNELLDVDIGPDLDLDFMPGGWKLTPLTSSSTTTTTTLSSTTTQQQTTDELLRVGSPSSNDSGLGHHHHHQQHHQHHQQLQTHQQQQQQHHNHSNHQQQQQHHHQQHHHHHHNSSTHQLQQQQHQSVNSNVGCNNGLSTANNGSSTLESLMCVGS